MKTHFNPKNNPRVIIIQKLYGKFYNEDNDIELPKHRFKKFIKDILDVDNVKDYIDVYLFGVKQPQDKYNVVISGNNIVIAFISDVTRLPGELSVNDFEIKGKIAEIL